MYSVVFVHMKSYRPCDKLPSGAVNWLLPWRLVANVLLIARRSWHLAMCCLVLETKMGVSGNRRIKLHCEERQSLTFTGCD